MAHHNVYTFFSVYNCLDEEFDAPDTAADHALCRAIVAGKRGMHPDAWGNHDPRQLRWLLRKRPWPGEESVGRVYHPSPADLREKQHRQRPVVWQRPRPPSWRLWRAPAEPQEVGGEIRLTCDECPASFGQTLHYPRGQRPVYVEMIRGLGKVDGWTCIAGRDRCPRCSQLAVPEAVGDGAGAGEGDKQHADRGQ